MICKKVREQLRHLLHAPIGYLEQHTETALAVTTTLKTLLASPVADIVTAIIPGELDDMVRDRLVRALDWAVAALTAETECRGAGIGERVQCFARRLAEMRPDLCDAVLLKLAALVAAQLDDRQHQQHVYDLCTQLFYTASKPI